MKLNYILIVAIVLVILLNLIDIGAYGTMINPEDSDTFWIATWCVSGGTNGLQASMPEDFIAPSNTICTFLKFNQLFSAGIPFTIIINLIFFAARIFMVYYAIKVCVKIFQLIAKKTKIQKKSSE